MKTKQTLLMFILCFTLAVAVSAVEQQKGASELTLSGGKGDIPFPHHLHQTAPGDCNVCHGTFPQKKGIIQDLKGQGKLKKKLVMNECRGCHKTRSKAGEKAGPTRCNGCHKK